MYSLYFLEIAKYFRKVRQREKVLRFAQDDKGICGAVNAALLIGASRSDARGAFAAGGVSERRRGGACRRGSGAPERDQASGRAHRRAARRCAAGADPAAVRSDGGEPCRTRTYNLEIKSLLLYQLS